MTELLSHQDLLGAAGVVVVVLGAVRALLRGRRRPRVIAPPVGAYRTYPTNPPLG
jgi:hypothetical protein